MAISPASATNLEWFVRHLCPDEVARAEQENRSPFAFVDRVARDVPGDPHDVLFLPFLYGSPQSRDSGAAFAGLRAWHDRAHLLRAVLDGVVFNHRAHIDDLRERFQLRRARLAGGGARAPYWAQLFADTLQLPIEVADIPEAGTLGAAVCAMTGAGWHPTITDAVDALALPLRSYEPDAARGPRLDAAYRRYRAVVDALADIPGTAS
jgi:L-xylulokinase